MSISHDNIHECRKENINNICKLTVPLSCIEYQQQYQEYQQHMKECNEGQKTCVPSLSKTTRTGSDTPTQSFSRPKDEDDEDDDGDDDDDDDPDMF